MITIARWKRTGCARATQSEKQRGQLGCEDQVDEVQNLDEGGRHVDGAQLPFDDRVEVKVWPEPSVGLLGLKRAPGAVADGERATSW